MVFLENIPRRIFSACCDLIHIIGKRSYNKRLQFERQLFHAQTLVRHALL